MIFRGMAKGDLPSNIKLRKGDYIKDWAGELNKCNSAIKAKLKEIKTGEKEISQILHDITQLQSDKKIPQESLIKMIDDLKHKHKNINEQQRTRITLFF